MYLMVEWQQCTDLIQHAASDDKDDDGVQHLINLSITKLVHNLSLDR